MSNSTNTSKNENRGGADEMKEDIKEDIKKVEKSGSLTERNKKRKHLKKNKNESKRSPEKKKKKLSQKVDVKKKEKGEGSPENKPAEQCKNEDAKKREESEGSPESNEDEQSKREDNKKNEESEDSSEKKQKEQAVNEDNDTESTVSRDSDGAPREPISPKKGCLSWFRFPSRRKEPCQKVSRKCCETEQSKRRHQSHEEKTMQKVMQALLRPQYSHFCAYMKSEIQKMKEDCGSLMVSGTYQPRSDRFFKREVKHMPAGTVCDEKRLAKRNNSKKKKLKILKHSLLRQEEYSDSGKGHSHETVDGENDEEDPDERSDKASEEGGNPSSSQLPNIETSSSQGRQDAPACSRKVPQSSQLKRKRPDESEEDKDNTPAKKRARHM